MQETLAFSCWYCPPGHWGQTVCAVNLLYRPTGQSRHEVPPALGWYTPVPQVMQLVASKVEKVPAPHVVQLDASAAAYVPFSQLVQFHAPAAANVPAPQVVQFLLRGRAVYHPPRQVAHEPAPLSA